MPRPPHIASTAHDLSDSVFGSLIHRARQSGRRVFSLHVGDTYLEPLASARAEAQRTSDHPRLHNYAPVQGEPALLDAIEAHLLDRTGVRVPQDRIQVMSGATAGLSVVVNALLDPGDEVLLPAPFWPLIRGIVRASGAVPVEVPLFTRLDEPGFDAVGALEAAITPKTVALYLNTPHNPTGRVLPAQIVQGIARLAREHDLWVLSDEVYADLWYGAGAPRPIWTYPQLANRTVATHSLSKSHGLAGARVGFTHGPTSAMEAIRGMQTFATYCAPRPMQYAAAHALREGDAWLAEAREAYARAGTRAAAALGLPAPEGGTFLFFDLTPHLQAQMTPIALLERCMEAGVLLTPGSACGQHYTHWARLCFTVLPPDELETALTCLRVAFALR